MPRFVSISREVDLANTADLKMIFIGRMIYNVSERIRGAGIALRVCFELDNTHGKQ